LEPNRPQGGSIIAFKLLRQRLAKRGLAQVLPDAAMPMTITIKGSPDRMP
jgi:hypothetical protein